MSIECFCDDAREDFPFYLRSLLSFVETNDVQLSWMLPSLHIDRPLNEREMCVRVKERKRALSNFPFFHSPKSEKYIFFFYFLTWCRFGVKIRWTRVIFNAWVFSRHWFYDVSMTQTTMEHFCMTKWQHPKNARWNDSTKQLSRSSGDKTEMEWRADETSGNPVFSSPFFFALHSIWRDCDEHWSASCYNAHWVNFFTLTQLLLVQCNPIFPKTTSF